MTNGFIAVLGLQLFFVTAGEGIPVLFIHGNTGSSRWYSRVMDIPGCQTFALDLPNFGRSSPLRGHTDLHVYADHAAEFIKATGMKNPVVVGHSLGGAVAQSLAIRHPESLRALVLVDSAPPGGYVTPADRHPFIEMMRKDRSILSRALAATVPTLRDPAFFEALVDDAVAMAERAWVGNAEALSRFDVSGSTRSFEKPVLVLWGRNDIIISESMARETARAYPKGRLEILDNVGHSVPVEDPAKFQVLLTEFISGL